MCLIHQTRDSCCSFLYLNWTASGRANGALARSNCCSGFSPLHRILTLPEQRRWTTRMCRSRSSRWSDSSGRKPRRRPTRSLSPPKRLPALSQSVLKSCLYLFIVHEFTGSSIDLPRFSWAGCSIGAVLMSASLICRDRRYLKFLICMPYLLQMIWKFWTNERADRLVESNSNLSSLCGRFCLYLVIRLSVNVLQKSSYISTGRWVVTLDRWSLQEFNIEKLQLVEAEKKKIRQEYERKEKQVEIRKKM